MEDMIITIPMTKNKRNTNKHALKLSTTSDMLDSVPNMDLHVVVESLWRTEDNFQLQEHSQTVKIKLSDLAFAESSALQLLPHIVHELGSPLEFRRKGMSVGVLLKYRIYRIVVDGDKKDAVSDYLARLYRKHCDRYFKA